MRSYAAVFSRCILTRFYCTYTKFTQIPILPFSLKEYWHDFKTLQKGRTSFPWYAVSTFSTHRSQTTRIEHFILIFEVFVAEHNTYYTAMRQYSDERRQFLNSGALCPAHRQHDRIIARVTGLQFTHRCLREPQANQRFGASTSPVTVFPWGRTAFQHHWEATLLK